MLKNKAILTLPSGDIGSPNDPVQGVFEFAADIEIAPSFRSGFLVGGAGAQINNVIQEGSGGDGAKGKGFFIDAGGGPHVVELQARGWSGARVPDTYNADGTIDTYKPAQWGSTGNPDTDDYGDATQEHPLTQLNVLEQYLRHIKIDSNSTATLEYGEFSSSGRFEPLDVVLEGPQGVRSSDGPPSAFDFTLTCIEAQALDEVVSAVNRTVGGN